MQDEDDEILKQVKLPEKKGVIEIIYYILGACPIKVIYVDGSLDLAQVFDFEQKKFVYDMRIMRRINDSMEVRKVSKTEFADACLALGVKPV